MKSEELAGAGWGLAQCVIFRTRISRARPKGTLDTSRIYTNGCAVGEGWRGEESHKWRRFAGSPLAQCGVVALSGSKFLENYI